jgi:hypothetical protein
MLTTCLCSDYRLGQNNYGMLVIFSTYIKNKCSFVDEVDNYTKVGITSTHQTTPNLMKNLNLNFPHECHNIYSVPLVTDDFTLNLAFIMSFTRFLSFFNKKINKHLKLSEKSETP